MKGEASNIWTLKWISETVKELILQALRHNHFIGIFNWFDSGYMCAPLFTQSSLSFCVEWASTVDFYPVFEKVVIEGMTYSVSALWTTPREDYPPYYIISEAGQELF